MVVTFVSILLIAVVVMVDVWRVMDRDGDAADAVPADAPTRPADPNR